MKRFFSLLICLMIVLSFAACNGRKDIDNAAGSTEQEEETVSVFEIRAGKITFKYPVRWKDSVKVEADEKKAAFSCDGTPLFDLLLNADTGTPFGTIRGENFTTIHIVLYELDQNAETLRAMQEDVNVIRQNLIKDYDFVSGEILTPADTETFAIKTKYATLYYPEKWKTKVNVDIDDTVVRFTCGENKLFDFVFGECDGYFLGTYKDATPVYLISYASQADLSDMEVRAMLEDVNIIIEHLEADANFLSAE